MAEADADEPLMADMMPTGGPEAPLPLATSGPCAMMGGPNEAPRVAGPMAGPIRGPASGLMAGDGCGWMADDDDDDDDGGTEAVGAAAAAGADFLRANRPDAMSSASFQKSGSR